MTTLKSFSVLFLQLNSNYTNKTNIYTRQQKETRQKSERCRWWNRVCETIVHTPPPPCCTVSASPFWLQSSRVDCPYRITSAAAIFLAVKSCRGQWPVLSRQRKPALSHSQFSAASWRVRRRCRFVEQVFTTDSFFLLLPFYVHNNCGLPFCGTAWSVISGRRCNRVMWFVGCLCAAF